MNLTGPFNERAFDEFIKSFLPDFVFDKRPASSGDTTFAEVLYLGESDSLRTAVFVVETDINLTSRATLTKASFRLLKRFGRFRGLIVYLNDDRTIWRLSLLNAQPSVVDGRLSTTYSSAQRHSYLLGTAIGVATARKFLLGLGQVQSFEDLKFRFSLEAINSEFYRDIAKLFYELIGRFDESGSLVQEPRLCLPEGTTHQQRQEYGIRLLGRMIFCWFLKEKMSKEGTQLLPSLVFDEGIENADNVLRDILEPLFFGCLNVPHSNRTQEFDSLEYQLVPYLNGGLFEPTLGGGGDHFDGIGRTIVRIPNHWFVSLVEILRTYNFTIDENLEYDVDLSIDPEMLGRIFENLLAEINPDSGESARRTTGSFYTPRRVVNFMVDETLTEFLRFKTGLSEEKLRALVSIDPLDDEDFPLSEPECTAVASALYSLKALDPACGSGAFPLGLLQKLLYVLERTDSDFTVGKRLTGSHDDYTRNPATSNLTYLRKRLLIRDVLHGVDVQPIAVEISKLRCFLTLIVEQEVLDDQENRGLEPLPNLNFNFVSANSLIPIDEAVQVSLWDSTTEEQLNRVRAAYFSTSSYSERERLRLEYAQLAVEDSTSGTRSRRVIQQKSFRPFEANTQANFFDPMVMFGTPSFDVVIGNPPYVKTEHLSVEEREELLNSFTEIRNGRTRNWSDDLYVHFVFRAFDFVGDGGIVCFICNDSFVALESKYRVRRKLLEENLLLLIGCPKETFGATIYTAIFLSQKGVEPGESYTAGRFDFPSFELTEVAKIEKDYVRHLPNSRLALRQNKLVAQLLSAAKLGEFFHVVDAGIHSGNVRSKLFSLTQTEEICERMIQGRQIVRWAVNWDSPDAQFRYCNPKYEVKDDFGIGRGGRRSSRKEYWHFCSDPINHSLPERVLLRQTSDSLYAAFQSIESDGQLFTDNTLFTVYPKGDVPLKYLLGLLNSRLLNNLYRFLSGEEGRVLAQVKIGLVEQLPFIFDTSIAPKVIELVDEAIAIRRREPSGDVNKVEEELDALVALIYGASDFGEEIRDITGVP